MEEHFGGFAYVPGIQVFWSFMSLMVVGRHGGGGALFCSLMSLMVVGRHGGGGGSVLLPPTPPPGKSLPDPILWPSITLLLSQ